MSRSRMSLAVVALAIALILGLALFRPTAGVKPPPPEVDEALQEAEQRPQSGPKAAPVAKAQRPGRANPEPSQGTTEEIPDELPEETYEFVEITDTHLVLDQRIHFENDGVEGDSRELIDEVAEILLDHPQIELEIGGHTDSRGSGASNQELSEERANVVRDALIDRGVDPDRLEAVGFGEDRPIASNQESQGRATNRRMEFVRTDSEE